MRFLLACAALGVAGSCLAAETLAADFPALVASLREDSTVPGAARLEIEQGVSSWNENRFLAARNHWVRAQAWMEKLVPEDGPAREEIAVLVEEADRLSAPEPPLELDAKPSPTPRIRRGRSPHSGRARSSPRLSAAGKVMERARAAQKAGQFEKAARLMRIASTLPGGEGAAEQAEALEQAAINGSDNGW